MNALPSNRLNEPVRGWLRHLWRKSMTPDTWTRAGNPHPWWDQYSEAPMLSFPRFDLSESSYALLLMGRRTPAWREVYTKILDELIRRHTTYWAAIDWLTQIGPDPDRKNYPFRYRALIPRDLWGEYDVPGWTANGVEPWGVQPDPIGSDGFLFFRGWFNLMLGIHRAVSGEETWQRPFEMVGLDDRTFPWTHTGITQFLGDQWRRVPAGPHCENTKIWPTCLSAAGLGLQLTDLTTGTRTHDVVGQWAEDFLMKKYMKIDNKRDVRWVANYYDPQLERAIGKSRIVGLGTAFYLLSQNRPLAESMYRAGVAAIGWDKPFLATLGLPGAPRAMSVALMMAREFGDHTTERRLARKLESIGGGRYFDGSEGSVRSNGRSRPASDRDSEANGDSQGDEFGYFFNFKEPWPRGQESALLILRHLIDGEGDWSNAFLESDAEKFSAPTIVGVDYPRMGLSRARNDAASENLEIETYAATHSDHGTATQFRVTQLPDSGSVSVLRDGKSWSAWKAVDASTIEIETEIADHSFEIHTGYRPGIESRRSTDLPEKARPGPASMVQRARLRPLDLASVTAAITGGMGGCPCCPGG